MRFYIPAHAKQMQIYRWTTLAPDKAVHFLTRWLLSYAENQWKSNLLQVLGDGSLFHSEE